MVQLRGIAFVIAFAPIATAGILLALQALFGSLRVDEENEVQGLDLAEHSESAYGFSCGGTIVPEAAPHAAGLAMSSFVPQSEQVGCC